MKSWTSEEKTKNTDKISIRSTLLPVGIAMMLLSSAFTFGSGEIRWLWQSEPHVAVLLVAVGPAMIGAHALIHARHRSSS